LLTEGFSAPRGEANALEPSAGVTLLKHLEKLAKAGG